MIRVPGVEEPKGMAHALMRILQEDGWNRYLAETDLRGSTIDGLGKPQVRQSVAVILKNLTERDLRALSVYVKGGRGKGWEYRAFRKRLRNELGEWPADDDPLGILEENRFVELRICEDSLGLFVSVTPGCAAEAKLVYAILRQPPASAL